MVRRALLPTIAAAAALAGCGSSTPPPAHPGPDRAVLQADLQVQAGSAQGWAHAVRARPGELLQLRMPIRNAGREQIPDLKVRLRVPRGLDVQPSTVRVQPVATPALGDPVDGLDAGGADLGPFPPDSATQIQFAALVAPHAPHRALTAVAHTTGAGQDVVCRLTVNVG